MDPAECPNNSRITMKLSIITVCWNSEAVLPRAMASLSAQSYKDYEWIVIDGVSTDGTLGIAQSFSSAPLILISEPDKGIYDAMNKGIANAQGDYIFFLNSDDAFHDKSVLTDVMDSFAMDPQLDLLFGNVVYQYPVERVLRTFAHINADTLIFEDLCHQAVFSRRSLFEQVGSFNERFLLNADYDWLIRVFRSSARWRRLDRNIAIFNTSGAHTQNPTKLSKERREVRLQYISAARIVLGGLRRRVIHRWHRHFRSHPLGRVPLKNRNFMNEVILLSHGFQPEYEAGFANGLARNDMHVILIGSDTTLCNRIEASVEVINLRRSQDPRRPVWKKALNLMRYWFDCFAFLWQHRNIPVHVIGTFTTSKLWISLIEAWLTRWISGHYVLTVHNLVPHDRHNAVNTWLSRHIYQTAAVCMVHTRRMKDELVLEFRSDPEKVIVVEHGIDRLLLRTESSRREMRAQLALSEQNRVILFFGSIAPYKGLDILLSAYDLLSDQPYITLLIAGRCKDPVLRKWLQQAIKDREATANILWLDSYIPDADVPNLFHASDLLAMPYRHIDQSGVIFMAMATALPVVASDVGMLRDYIPPECGAIVPPNDVNALALALSSWLIKAKSGRTVISPSFAENFYWSHTVVPMLPVYASLSVE